MTPLIVQMLMPYQKKVNAALENGGEYFGSPKNKLEEAIVYALTQGGKRFRPALVLMWAKAIGKGHDVMDAALAVEYFHTASLIADDLPSMDNDPERRGKPSTHVIYGDAVALLASYTLIGAGYDLLARNSNVLKKQGVLAADHLGILAIQNATANTGVAGATGGQFIDLFPPAIDLPTYKETAIKKTVSLFEISFVSGWLFGGGDESKLPTVKKAAYHFGMAFQIADDFDDFQKDQEGDRQMNAVSLLGLEGAHRFFSEEIEGYLTCLDLLKIHANELIAIADYLKSEMCTEKHTSR